METEFRNFEWLVPLRPSLAKVAQPSLSIGNIHVLCNQSESREIANKHGVRIAKGAILRAALFQGDDEKQQEEDVNEIDVTFLKNETLG